MKDLKHFLNDGMSVNEADIETPDMEIILNDIRAALPELEDEIRKALGDNSMKFTLKCEIRQGWNKTVFDIHSDDNLVKYLGKGLWKTLFKTLEISWWGGEINKNGKVWFNPKIQYQHPQGGSNGTDFIWDTVWWDIAEKKWEFGSRIFK